MGQPKGCSQQQKGKGKDKSKKDGKGKSKGKGKEKGPSKGKGKGGKSGSEGLATPFWKQGGKWAKKGKAQRRFSEQY